MARNLGRRGFQFGNRLGKKHGLTKTPEHLAWVHMRGRCLNPKVPRYPRYGGRGIYICPAWLDNFEQFLRDIGPRPSPEHSLDRIDNDGSYTCGKCPDCVDRDAASNCRWATDAEQFRSRSPTVKIWFDGKEWTYSELSAVSGIPAFTIRQRIKKGMTVEQAMVPLRSKGKAHLWRPYQKTNASSD